MAAPSRKTTGTPKRSARQTRSAKQADGAKESARRALGRQVSQELLKLRSTVKDVGTALLDRLDGELAGLAHTLDGGSLAGDTPVLPKAPVLSAMLADVKALKLKPKKGRVKDLRRIEFMLESLSARIPPGA